MWFASYFIKFPKLQNNLPGDKEVEYQSKLIVALGKPMEGIIKNEDERVEKNILI